MNGSCDRLAWAASERVGQTEEMAAHLSKVFGINQLFKTNDTFCLFSIVVCDQIIYSSRRLSRKCRVRVATLPETGNLERGAKWVKMKRGKRKSSEREKTEIWRRGTRRIGVVNLESHLAIHKSRNIKLNLGDIVHHPIQNQIIKKNPSQWIYPPYKKWVSVYLSIALVYVIWGSQEREEEGRTRWFC